MYVTALSFDHIREAEQEQFLRELEYRRIAHERGADTESATARMVHRIARLLHRPAHARPAVLSPSR